MGPLVKTNQVDSAFWQQARSPADVLDLGVPLRQALGLQRLGVRQGKPLLSRREGILLGVLALTLHGAVLFWLSQREEPVLPEVPVQIPPMTIEFASAPPPEPVAPIVEPPPPPPPPVVEELAVKKPEPPKPKPKPEPKPQPKPEPKPQPKPEPPKPAPKAETPPAPPAPAPVKETPPSANAGYLNNPAPEYPSLAHRRGWEGTVLLRVHVLANGKPGEIQVQKSSGRDALDEAALRAVKRWSFVPAKRGEQAIDGWVTVPLDFRLD